MSIVWADELKEKTEMIIIVKICFIRVKIHFGLGKSKSISSILIGLDERV